MFHLRSVFTLYTSYFVGLNGLRRAEINLSVAHSDYKLYASRLAKAIRKHIIGEDQTKLIQTRQTQDNINQALHLVES